MSKIDAIQARADAAQSAWEAYMAGGSEVRIINRANDSAEDVKPMLAALRAVEAVHADSDGWCAECVHDRDGSIPWPCPTITAIREALN